MRVIAGTCRGLRLQAPEGWTTRPTADRVREAVMSALGGFFDGGHVLDVCAGTGAVGIEMLSRGAERAVFIEPAGDAIAAIQANLGRCKLADRADLIPLTADKALARLNADGRRFEFAWIDPPWDADLVGSLVADVASANVMSDDGEIIVEAPRTRDAKWPVPTGWTVAWQRAYGRCEITRLVRDQGDDRD